MQQRGWMFSLVRSVAAAVAACALAGTASAESHGAKVAAGVVITAEVVAIDRADRTVTLVGPRGNAVEIEAGDEVRNFDQIDVGDKVKVTYVESVALFIGEPGFLPEDKAVGMVGRAAKGEKPAGMIAETVDVAASVLEIDRKHREVTLLLSDGTTHGVEVDPSVKAFDTLRIGDKIHARLTQAFAISVEPAAASR